MDNQEHLPGVNVPGIELDDSKAFSLYIDAIDRISNQYGLWEEAQNELLNYQEIYRVSKELSQSISLSIIVDSSGFECKKTLPASVAFAQKQIDELSGLANAIKLVRQEIKTIESKKESGIIQLESERTLRMVDFDKSINKLKDKSREIEASFSQFNEIKEIEEKLALDSEGSNRFDKVLTILPIAWIVISIIRTIFSMATANKISSLIGWIVTAVFVFSVNLFTTYAIAGFAGFLLVLTGLIVSPDLLYFFGSRFSAAEKKLLDNKRNNLISRRDSSIEEGHRLNKEIATCLSDQDEFIKNSDLAMLDLQSSSRQKTYESNAALKKLEQDFLCQIKKIADYYFISQNIALKILPLAFKNMIKECNPILGTAIEFWENGTQGTPLRMLARPWEDNAWISSYQPPIGTQLPDCVRIGNYLIDQIHPETNQIINPMKVPAMIPVRAIKQKSQARLPGHIVIFSNTQTRNTAIQLLESIATRLISTFPVRTLKGSFVDPIALGDTFPFIGLPKSILSGQQILTRSQDIREELKILVGHVEQILQRYLSRSYETLEDYNTDIAVLFDL